MLGVIRVFWDLDKCHPWGYNQIVTATSVVDSKGWRTQPMKNYKEVASDD